MRETQGAAAELASDVRSGRTRRTRRTGGAGEAPAAVALDIGERLAQYTSGGAGTRSGGREGFARFGVEDSRSWDEEREEDHEWMG